MDAVTPFLDILEDGDSFSAESLPETKAFAVTPFLDILEDGDIPWKYKQ